MLLIDFSESYLILKYEFLENSLNKIYKFIKLKIELINIYLLDKMKVFWNFRTNIVNNECIADFVAIYIIVLLFLVNQFLQV